MAVSMDFNATVLPQDIGTALSLGQNKTFYLETYQ